MLNLSLVSSLWFSYPDNWDVVKPIFPSTLEPTLVVVYGKPRSNISPRADWNWTDLAG